MCGVLITKDKDKKHSINHRGIETGPIFKLSDLSDFCFIHRRLPIQTLARDEWAQPIKIQTNIFMLFVGEIFNYDITFSGAGRNYENDVQYLAKFFERYSNFSELTSREAQEEINQWDGFWGIVLVNAKEDELVVMTDPLGKKQLYYNTDTFEICSEIMPLMDNNSLLDNIYFSIIAKWGYNTDDRTPYINIKRFMPNTIYRISMDSMREERWGYNSMQVFNNYYNFLKNIPQRCLYDIIHKSVERRLISKNYPISLLLSGGLDSTIILHHLKELKANVSIYAIENEEDKEFVDLCAAWFNVEVQYLDYDMANEDLETVYTWNETPVDLGSVIPQHKLFSRRKTRIVLSGDGSDELFGGYKRIKDYDSQGSDVFEELPFYHNVRLDRASMRYTTELRCPFMGHDVVRYALQLPYAKRINKSILKQTYLGNIPTEIITREKLPLKNPIYREDKIKYRLELIEKFYGWRKIKCPNPEQ